MWRAERMKKNLNEPFGQKQGCERGTGHGQSCWFPSRYPTNKLNFNDNSQLTAWSSQRLSYNLNNEYALYYIFKFWSFFFPVEIYLHNVLVEETIEVRANLNLCLKEHTPKTNAQVAIA